MSTGSKKVMAETNRHFRRLDTVGYQEITLIVMR
jgi:hypothetical protein